MIHCQNRRSVFIIANNRNCFWYPVPSFPYVNKICLHKHFHTTVIALSVHITVGSQGILCILDIRLATILLNKTFNEEKSLPFW